jgi:quinoprotein glucose dehydrogenase
LEVAWIWHSGDLGSTIECNPIIIDGIMYVTTPRIHCVALDAATGKMIWRFDPWNGKRGGGISRGVALIGAMVNRITVFFIPPVIIFMH